jgi:hypothetical protein
MTTKRKTEAELLAEMLAKFAPTATIEVTKPSGRGSVWWVEATFDGHLVSAEWEPGSSFGIRTPSEDDYGTAPSETFKPWKEALARMLTLLITGEKAQPRREMLLRELRESREVPQEELAKSLDVSQAHVSQTERRGDLRLSTLRGYIEALGGELVVSAKFDGERIDLKLGESGQHGKPTSRARP